MLTTEIYHGKEQRATALAQWWLRPVAPPDCKDSKTVQTLYRSLRHTVREMGSAKKVAALHAINAICRLAKNRRGSWAQVSVLYLKQGVGCGFNLAREILNTVSRTLMCSRTNAGYLTTIPEAVAACLLLIDEEGAPEPLISSDNAEHYSEMPGDIYSINVSDERGSTRCPCPDHHRGDIKPSLLYDCSKNRATCMVSGRVFRKVEKGKWLVIRGTWQGVDNYRPPGATPFEAVEPLPLPQTPTRTRTASVAPWIDHKGLPLWSSRDPIGTRPNAVIDRYFWKDAEVRSSCRLSLSYTPLARRLKWCNSRYGGPKSRQRAEMAAGALWEVPDLLMSVCRRKVTEWKEFTRKDGLIARVPSRWEVTGTDLVLLDLDGLDPRSTDLDEAVAEDILDLIRKHSGGALEPASITATSEEGLQILCRLPGICDDPKRLRRHLPFRSMLRNVGKLLIASLNRGGKLDECVWDPQRLCRRPGWRVKNGLAVRAQLWWAEDAERDTQPRSWKMFERIDSRVVTLPTGVKKWEILLRCGHVVHQEYGATQQELEFRRAKETMERALSTWENEPVKRPVPSSIAFEMAAEEIATMFNAKMLEDEETQGRKANAWQPMQTPRQALANPTRWARVYLSDQNAASVELTMRDTADRISANIVDAHLADDLTVLEELLAVANKQVDRMNRAIDIELARIKELMSDKNRRDRLLSEEALERLRVYDDDAVHDGRHPLTPPVWHCNSCAGGSKERDVQGSRLPPLRVS